MASKILFRFLYFLHRSEFSTINVDIVSSLHPSYPHTWWRGCHPPTDHLTLNQHHHSISASGIWSPVTHPLICTSFTSGPTPQLSLCLHNAQAQPNPNAQFFTTYITLTCRSLVIINNLFLSDIDFQCKSLVHPDTH